MVENIILGIGVGIVRILVDELLEDDENQRAFYGSSEKQENFAEIAVPNFSDNQFQQHFRMLPETFEILLRQLHDANDNIRVISRGQPEIPIEKQTLITLWCLSNIECFR